MSIPPKFNKGEDSFYGYNPDDVIRVGGPAGKSTPGTPGVKGDKGDQGLPGIDGGMVVVTAGSVIHGRRVVRVSDGLAFHPDILNNQHASEILGISMQAGSLYEVLPIRVNGPVSDSSWFWVPGYVFCGADGVLTQTPGSTGWLQRVGRVINATTISIDIDTPLIRIP
ncbi:MAG: hypothetical protein ABIR46_00760 [Candidatus Saccharimonadales bacterium]